MMIDLTPVLCPRTGRDTWPKIVQYRITEGSQTGMVLDYPPDRETFPAPLVFDSAMGREGRRTGSAGYRILIHDREAYEELARSGALYSPRHTGADGELIDNGRAAHG